MPAAKPKPKKYGRRYPWARWLARSRFTLLRGKDYTIETRGMVQMLRSTSLLPKYRVKLKITTLPRDAGIKVVRLGILPPPGAPLKRGRVKGVKYV